MDWIGWVWWVGGEWVGWLDWLVAEGAWLVVLDAKGYKPGPAPNR